MIYRGLGWWEDSPDIGMTGSGVHAESRDGQEVLFVSHRRLAREGVKTLAEAAAQWHTAAMVDVKYLLHTLYVPVFSVDGVPWEIHWIEDEAAYEIALESYLSNVA